MALEFYKGRVIDLEKDLTNTKIFLNMVIHDLRNPVNNISFAIDNSLKNLKKSKALLINYEDDLINDIVIFSKSNSNQDISPTT